MHPTIAIALAFALGIVAGLRALTPPMAVAWAARLGWLNLNDSPFAFMASTVAVVAFTAAALAEYVHDVLPRTPARTEVGPVIARAVSGALCGACLCVSAGASWPAGAVAGAVGGVAGAFLGYQARVRLVKALRVPDAVVGVSESVLAILLAWACIAVR